MDGPSDSKRNAIPVNSRPLRADARRNVEALLEAAKTAFTEQGVDAPMKGIADLAGVGVGTLYRHFPTRAELIKAHLVDEIDAHAEAAEKLLGTERPGVALRGWLLDYAEFIANKPKLAPALHSGDPTFDGLREYFWQRLGPALSALLEAGVAGGELRSDIDAADLLTAMSDLAHSAARDPSHNGRMVSLLIDGLRVRAE